MTREEIEDYCANMRDLFLTPGWDWLVAECTDAINMANDIQLIQDERQLYIAKGCVNMAQQIINLPDSVEQLEAELDEPDEDVDN